MGRGGDIGFLVKLLWKMGAWNEMNEFMLPLVGHYFTLERQEAANEGNQKKHVPLCY